MEELSIIKRLEIGDVVVLVCKKEQREYHMCKHCKQISVNPIVKDLYYCDKYKALVRMDDYCIEDGM